MTLEEAIAVLKSPQGRDETKRVYFLNRAVDFAEFTMRSHGTTREDAEQLIDAVARYAEELFEGSGDTFRIIYGARFRRILEEVFGPSD